MANSNSYWEGESKQPGGTISLRLPILPLQIRPMHIEVQLSICHQTFVVYILFDCKASLHPHLLCKFYRRRKKMRHWEAFFFTLILAREEWLIDCCDQNGVQLLRSWSTTTLLVWLTDMTKLIVATNDKHRWSKAKWHGLMMPQIIS